MFNIKHDEDLNKRFKIDPMNNPIDDINIKNTSNVTRDINIDIDSDDDDDDDVDDIGINYITDESKRREVDTEEVESVNQTQSQYSEEYDYQEQEQEQYEQEQDQDEPILSHDEIQHQKGYYLSKLKRLEQRGQIPLKRLGIEHPLNVIKGEYYRLIKEKDIENGVEMCRMSLMTCMKGLEYMNSKFDSGLDLNGLTKSIVADQQKYDEVFEELYEKYKSSLSMGPELKLIFMVGASVSMFALNKNANKIMRNVMGQETKKKEMRGPSFDTEELMRKMNEDDGDMSDVSSIMSEKNIIIPATPKKRGRKPKKK